MIITTPSVPYLLTLKPKVAKTLKQTEILVCNPADWRPGNEVESYCEPIVKGTIIAPHEYQRSIVSLCEDCRGEQVGLDYIDQHRMKVFS